MVDMIWTNVSHRLEKVYIWFSRKKSSNVRLFTCACIGIRNTISGDWMILETSESIQLYSLFYTRNFFDEWEKCGEQAKVGFSWQYREK